MSTETIEGTSVVAPSLGPLAAALAKAQAEFATVTRDKTVTVTTKAGKSYSFSYAPLESILAAVRGPLSKNGLVLVQMLDEGALETTLLHESGASISGRIGLPGIEDIQGFGSAITYLRRYAIQAVLGIAAEDDDDGNHAAGNTIAIPAPERTDDGGLIGVAEVGTTKDSDFELRETPDGWALGFRLKANGRGGIKVIARDAIAQGLAASKAETVGQRVTCWGRITDESFTPKSSGKKITYQVLQLERIQTPAFTLPAAGGVGAPVEPEVSEPEASEQSGSEAVAPGQEALPLTDDERALIAAGLPE